MNYPPGGVLVREGDHMDDALIIIIKGNVTVLKREFPENILATLGAGSVLGEISFLTKRPRTTQVSALDAVMAFRLDGDTMATLPIETQGRIKDQLIDVLIGHAVKMSPIMGEPFVPPFRPDSPAIKQKDPTTQNLLRNRLIEMLIKHLDIANARANAKNNTE
jgi:hypothetical protein